MPLALQIDIETLLSRFNINGSDPESDGVPHNVPVMKASNETIAAWIGAATDGSQSALAQLQKFYGTQNTSQVWVCHVLSFWFKIDSGKIRLAQTRTQIQPSLTLTRHHSHWIFPCLMFPLICCSPSLFLHLHLALHL